MVDVTHRADVQVRLVPLELLFAHDGGSLRDVLLG
jgi:hypothetical protein